MRVEITIPVKLRAASRALVCVALFALPSLAQVGDQSTNKVGIPQTSDQSTVYSGSDNPEQRTGVPEDWTHKHLIFSNPGSLNDASRDGRIGDWFRVMNDPRYKVQQTKRNAPARRNAGASGVFRGFSTSLEALGSEQVARAKKQPPPPPPNKPKGDWSVSLGGASANVAATMYPAKYTFNINAAPSCANDFAAFAADVTGVTAVAASGTMANDGTAPASSSTVTVGGQTYKFKSSLSSCSPFDVLISGTSGSAANLTHAIQADGTTGVYCAGTTQNALVSATNPSPPSGNVALQARTVGSAGNSISWSSSTGNPKGHFGSGSLSGGVNGQPSIVAINNLYSGIAIAASADGTVSANSLAGGEQITITNGANSLVLTASAPTPATGTLTFTGTPAADGGSGSHSRVTIGATTYRFVSSLSSCSAGYVAIGGSANAAADNLKRAINLDGTGGTNYCASTVINASVSATVSGNVVTVKAKTPGTATSFVYSPDTAGNTNITLSPASPVNNGTDGLNTGTNFQYWSGSSAVSATQLATNLAAAIHLAGNGSSVGVDATSSGTVVTVTATTAGFAGNSITLAENLSGFTWSDVALGGGIDQGICGTGGPTVTWAYNTKTGTGGPVSTSPILSFDGKKIAYVENIGSGSVLHVLRWNAGEGTVAAPATPTHVITSGTCPADSSSCLFNLTYTTSGNSFSSPFYNYGTDELYVADDGGKLWKIRGVFNGTPTVSTQTGWSGGIVVTTGTSSTLGGPVFDSTSGNIFFMDKQGALHYVRESGSTAGACGTGSPPCVGSTTVTVYGTSMSVIDPPIVDSFEQKVFAFGAAGKVVQTNTALGSQVTVQVGGLSSGNVIHVGTFDNDYLTNGPTATTGFLYVVGEDTSNHNQLLYRIGFTGTAGTLKSSTDGSTLILSTSTGPSSPLGEIFNPNVGAGGTEWLFVGIPSNCAFGGSSSGCVMSLDITSAFPTSASALTAAEAGGTSAIVVDNVSVDGHASSLYFSTLGNASCDVGGSSGGCAVKRTQSRLQ